MAGASSIRRVAIPRRPSPCGSSAAGGTGTRPRNPLADECEAFLAGRYPHHLFASGQAIPPWAWLNPLAHAQVGGLLAIARHQPDRGEAIATWSGAIGRLASEILELTGQDPIALGRLQLDLLVPLELRLAAGPGDPDAPTGPEELLDRVLELLILSSW